MKRIILAGVTLLATSAIFAQSSGTNSNAVLNVNVSSVKSISVSSGSTVNINLDNTEKFTNAAGTAGVDGDLVSTLDVISSGAYKIKVSLASNATTLNNTNSSAQGITTIPVDYIYLTVSNPRQIVPNSVVPSAAYSNTRQNLINKDAALIATPESGIHNGDAGTSGTQYDVKYTLANYPAVASLAPGTFTATVVYTITDL